jgi:Iron-containing redox enzyme
MADQQLVNATSEHLRGKIELLLPAVVDATDRFVSHPSARDLYPEYLFTSHCIIRASVPLMEEGRGQAQAAAAADPVSAALAPYLEEHIPEELHHDEWLLDDLEVLGKERSDILARPPTPTIAALVGAQYYWIRHYHPVALLGYIAVLEGYPPTTALIDALVAKTGYSREAFRTLIAHAELDPGHRDELDELLDTLSLTREQSEVLGLSAMFTVHMLTRALDEVINRNGYSAA